MAYTVSENPTNQINFSTPGSTGGVFIFNGALMINGHTISGQGSQPAVVATTGAAASNGSSTLTITGGDSAGFIVLGTTANAVAGAEVLVTFGQAYLTRPYVDISPANASTAAANCFVAASTNSFTISSGISSAASGTRAWQYSVNG